MSVHGRPNPRVCSAASFIILSAQTGGWDGNSKRRDSVFEPGLPNHMYVDYVKVWSGTKTGSASATESVSKAQSMSPVTGMGCERAGYRDSTANPSELTIPNRPHDPWIPTMMPPSHPSVRSASPPVPPTHWRTVARRGLFGEEAGGGDGGRFVLRAGGWAKGRPGATTKPREGAT